MTRFTPTTTPPHRRIAIIARGKPLRCPNGHRPPKNFFNFGKLDEKMGGYRCTHRNTSGERNDCGVIVYFLVIPDGTRILVEITPHEARDMEERHLDFAGVCAYLGIEWDRKAG